MHAGLARRLAAMLYDGLLLLAIFMLVTAAFLPLTGGEVITPRTNPALEYLYRAVLAGIVVLFYGAFWTRAGQTLGMASWRLKVEREDGARLTWGDTLKRLGAAVLSVLPLGLGYLWILLDRDRRAWHDRLSRTRVVVVPKGERRRKE